MQTADELKDKAKKYSLRTTISILVIYFISLFATSWYWLYLFSPLALIMLAGGVVAFLLIKKLSYFFFSNIFNAETERRQVKTFSIIAIIACVGFGLFVYDNLFGPYPPLRAARRYIPEVQEYFHKHEAEFNEFQGAYHIDLIEGPGHIDLREVFYTDYGYAFTHNYATIGGVVGIWIKYDKDGILKNGTEEKNNCYYKLSDRWYIHMHLYHPLA